MRPLRHKHIDRKLFNTEMANCVERKRLSNLAGSMIISMAENAMCLSFIDSYGTNLTVKHEMIGFVLEHVMEKFNSGVKPSSFNKSFSYFNTMIVNYIKNFRDRRLWKGSSSDIYGKNITVPANKPDKIHSVKKAVFVNPDYIEHYINKYKIDIYDEENY